MKTENTTGIRSDRVLGRRAFLGTAAMGSLVLAVPQVARAAVRALKKPVKIGVIADLHHDVMHDGLDRMKAFTTRMSIDKPDAIMQLGDFAYPNADNKEVIDHFNQAHKQSLHVIGNHDMDAGMTRENCIDVWGIPARYYTQQVGGMHMLVLDGNDPGSPTYTGGYAAYIGKEQVEWLKAQLKAIDGPIIVVSHQPLAGSSAVDNAEEIQAILSGAADKVVLAINGHTHVDDVLRVGGVTYLHVNSASYKWVGGNHKHESYPKAIHEKHRWISYTCPYRDPLFATLTIDPETSTIVVKGAQSKWVGESPDELGVPLAAGLEAGRQVVPRIRDREISKPRGQ
ncbi:MAG: metallophosphoesterase [Phycisphaerales bacterium]|nr:metallophosphoesterase [Phycisphaerales bacterium]